MLIYSGRASLPHTSLDQAYNSAQNGCQLRSEPYTPLLHMVDATPVLAALSRLYNARLSLLELESFARQEALLPSRFETLLWNPFRSYIQIATVATIVGSLSIHSYFFLVSYWRGTILGVLSGMLGMVAWSVYKHHQRVILLSQQLNGHLSIAHGIRVEIDEVVYDLEAVLNPNNQGKTRFFGPGRFFGEE